MAVVVVIMPMCSQKRRMACLISFSLSVSSVSLDARQILVEEDEDPGGCC